MKKITPIPRFEPRKAPKGGWYKGPPETAPGRYVESVGIATSAFVPGLSAAGEKDGVQAWSGQAIFLGDKEKVESGIHDIAWSCRYQPKPGAEARCRKATQKAIAALQGYYDRTGKRWEVLRKASKYTLPKLPPLDAE
jgi:hypothetical protein